MLTLASSHERVLSDAEIPNSGKSAVYAFDNSRAPAIQLLIGWIFYSEMEEFSESSLYYMLQFSELNRGEPFQSDGYRDIWPPACGGIVGHRFI